MNRRNLIVAVLAATLTVAAVPFLSAQPDRRDMDHHGFLGLLQHAREELGLSEQQTDEIRAIFASLREQNAPYRDQLQGGREAIFTTLLQNPANVAAAQALANQQAQAEGAMRANALTATAKALAVLTADQRAELASMIGKRPERRRR